nr:polyserase-2-like [Aedes albopictus]
MLRLIISCQTPSIRRCRISGIIPRLTMRVFALLGLGLSFGLCFAQLADGAGNCGEKKVVSQQLIANGYRALAGSWPWHGAMFHRYREGMIRYACGVTILTEQFVITAAHCTLSDPDRQKLPASRVFIQVGISNLDSPDRHMRQHNIELITRHEEYDQATFENDIALLKLYTEITYNDYIQPVCLWQGDAQLSKIISKEGFIVGWGRDEHYKLPMDLNEATAPIVSRRDCIASDPYHYNKYYFESKTFCAGGNGAVSTYGDSGGGLFLREGTSWVLRGIVSNGKADPNNNLKLVLDSYVIYVDVAFYSNWIESRVPLLPNQRPPVIEDANPNSNLLGLANCGKDTYPSGTPEEVKGYLNQYPWLAVIEFMGSNTHVLEDACHAVLIHPKFLVTAAHCIQKDRIRSIRLNDYRLDTKNDVFDIDGQSIPTTANRIAVHGISVHPNYDNSVFTNSIALVMLNQPSSAIPICLPPRGVTSLPSDKQFTIIGWKKNKHQEKPMIRNVVRLANFKACRSKYAEKRIPLDSSGGQVCSTYSHDDDSRSCSHYMGSAPFQYVNNGRYEGRYFLAAISSFGHSDCKRDEFPDVFTNVAHYSDWIYNKVKQYE